MKTYLKNLCTMFSDWHGLDRYERVDLLVDLTLIATSVGVLLYAIYFVIP